MGESYTSAEIQPAYSTAQVDGSLSLSLSLSSLSFSALVECSPMALQAEVQSQV